MQTIDGVDSFVVSNYTRKEDESLASSTSSGALLPHGFEIDSEANSPRQQQQQHVGLAEGDRNDDGRSKATTATHTKTPSITADEARLMEYRIRRLEVGRRRAEGIRRAASALRVAGVAKKQRKMLLTSDAGALLSAKSSFELLLLLLGPTAGGPTKDVLPAAAGLERGHILALRERIVRERSGGPSRRRGSVQIIVDAIRRGSVQVHRKSVQMMAEVRGRTLNRPGSPARKSLCTGSVVSGDPASPTAATTSGEQQHRDKRAMTVEDDDAVRVPPSGTGDGPRPANDAGTAVLSDVVDEEDASTEVEGALNGIKRGEGDDLGTTEPQRDPEEQPSPEKTLEEGIPSQLEQQQEKLPNMNVVTSNVPLDDLLAAVTGLSQKVEAEEPMGAAAYAAWWVGAVSEAELELKKTFLTPKFLGVELCT